MPPRAAKGGTASKASGSQPANRSSKGKSKAAPVEILDDDFSDDDAAPTPAPSKARQPSARGTKAASKIVIPQKVNPLVISDEDDELPEALPAPRRSQRIDDEEDDDEDVEMLPAKPLPAFMTQLNPALQRPAVAIKRKEPATSSMGSAEKRSKNSANGSQAATAAKDASTFKDPAARLRAARSANGNSPVDTAANAGPSKAAASRSSRAAARPSTAPQSTFMPTTTSSQPAESQDVDEDQSEDEGANEDGDEDDDGPAQPVPDPMAFQIPETSAPRPPANDWLAPLARMQQAMSSFIERLNNGQNGFADAAAGAAASATAEPKPPAASGAASTGTPSATSSGPTAAQPNTMQIVFPYALKRLTPSSGLAVAVVVECADMWADYIKRLSRQCYVLFYKSTVDSGLLMRLEFENFCEALKGRFPKAAYIATEARHDPDIEEEFENLEDAALAAAGLEPEMNDLFRQMQHSDAINGADALSTLVGSKDALLDVATLPFLPESTVQALKARGLKTELKSHQSQGVTYMVRQEHPVLPTRQSDPPVGLWKKRKSRLGETYYQNIANNRSLADGMGLGKTLQVLALVLADPTGKGVIDQNFKGVRVPVEEENATADASSATSKKGDGVGSASGSVPTTASSAASSSKSSKKDQPKKQGKVVNAHKARNLKKLDESYCKTTLIVCPLSVVVNWQQQIEQHCDLSKVSYYVLHGDKLRDRTHDLGKYDFVIVTYDTIKTEYRQYSKWREAEWAREAANGGSAAGSGKGPNKLKLLKDYEDDEEDKQPEVKSASTKKPDLKGKGKAKAEPADVWSSDEDVKKIDYKIGMEISDESDDDWDTPARPRGSQGHIPSQLFERKWRRLILDEGHICRNPKTRLFEAVMEIQAERIWTVTGTPIVNSTRDLQALVSFLKLAPLDDPKAWTRLIDKRIKRGQKAGLQLLQIIIRSHTLRRTKSMEDADGQPLVPLPKITIARHTIELDEDTREYYNEVEQAMKDVILNWIQVDALNRSRGHVLVFLSRLRQLACHRNLVPRSFLVDIKARMFEAAQKAAENDPESLSPEQVERLQEQLVAYIDGNEECPICIDVLTEPRITYCGHVFCLECIRQTILANPSCPMDRRPLPINTRLIAPPVARVVEDEMDQNDGDVTPTMDLSAVQSAKIEQLILLLNQTQREDNEIKSLVFSNFVGFLDHIAIALKKAGITYCRFDGSMSIERRNAVLEAFSRPNPAARKKPASGLLAQLEEAQARKQAIAASKGKLSHKLGKNAERDGLYQAPRVMLLSIGSGALGLNLVQASQVFLMDPWWQSAIEAQAIDRVHRIGQNRAIRVVQMIASGTVEERVLEIQKRKEDLIKDAFSSVRNRGKEIDVAHQERETRGLADLIALFGIGQAEREAAASSQDYM
ncbi:hypothetical protein OC861_005763 [Tilletia horrida]|nr:hypothetical protein OC861_005763 [Tilletia horrida]